MIEVRPPVSQFFDIDGSPLDAGYIWVGTTGANPETSPQAIYWDKEGLIPAPQPIRTINGYPARDGAAARFYTTTKNYSITVKNKKSILVQSMLNSDSGVFDELSNASGAASVGYNNASSGLAANDVQKAIDELKDDIDAIVISQNSQSSMVNLFFNSAFLINQRSYVSGTPTVGANQYTLDRIRVVVSGQSLTFSASTFGNRITAPVGGAEQVVEGRFIVGGDYVCSWAGTGSITVNGTARSKGEVFTLPAGINATIRMIGEFERFMLTRPDMAGRYEYDFNRDLIACMRYFEVIPSASIIGNAASAGAMIGSYIPFVVRKRVAPSITAGATTENINFSTTAYNPISDSGFRYWGEATAAGNAYITRPLFASAEI